MMFSFHPFRQSLSSSTKEARLLHMGEFGQPIPEPTAEDKKHFNHYQINENDKLHEYIKQIEKIAADPRDGNTLRKMIEGFLHDEGTISDKEIAEFKQAMKDRLLNAGIDMPEYKKIIAGLPNSHDEILTFAEKHGLLSVPEANRATLIGANNTKEGTDEEHGALIEKIDEARGKLKAFNEWRYARIEQYKTESRGMNTAQRQRLHQQMCAEIRQQQSVSGNPTQMYRLSRDQFDAQFGKEEYEAYRKADPDYQKLVASQQKQGMAMDKWDRVGRDTYEASDADRTLARFNRSPWRGNTAVTRHMSDMRNRAAAILGRDIMDNVERLKKAGSETDAAFRNHVKRKGGQVSGNPGYASVGDDTLKRTRWNHKTGRDEDVTDQYQNLVRGEPKKNSKYGRSGKAWHEKFGASLEAAETNDELIESRYSARTSAAFDKKMTELEASPNWKYFKKVRTFKQFDHYMSMMTGAARDDHHNYQRLLQAIIPQMEKEMEAMSKVSPPITPPSPEYDPVSPVVAASETPAATPAEKPAEETVANPRPALLNNVKNEFNVFQAALEKIEVENKEQKPAPVTPETPTEKPLVDVEAEKKAHQELHKKIVDAGDSRIKQDEAIFAMKNLAAGGNLPAMLEMGAINEQMGKRVPIGEGTHRVYLREAVKWYTKAEFVLQDRGQNDTAKVFHKICETIQEKLNREDASVQNNTKRYSSQIEQDELEKNKARYGSETPPGQVQPKVDTRSAIDQNLDKLESQQNSNKSKKIDDAARALEEIRKEQEGKSDAIKKAAEALKKIEEEQK